VALISFFGKVQNQFKPNKNSRSWILLGVVFATASQLLFIKIGYLIIPVDDYRLLLKFISLAAIWGVVIGNPVTAITSLAEAGTTRGKGKNYAIAGGILRRLHLALLALGLFSALVSVAVKNSESNLILNLVLFMLVSFRFSLDRGTAIGRKEWRRVFNQLCVEGIAKVILVIVAVQLFHFSNFTLTTVWLPQLIVVGLFWFKKIGNSNLPDRTALKIAYNEHKTILYSFWSNGLAFLATASVPILIAASREDATSKLVSNLAVTLMICRLPLSFSGAFIGPKLIEAISSGSEIDFKLSTIKTKLGIVAAVILSVLLNYCTVRYFFNIDMDGLLIAITVLSISTQLFFVGEVLTAILLTNNSFKQISFAWSLSAFTLIAGLVIAPVSLKTISVIIFLSATCLILGFGKNLRDLDPRRRKTNNSRQ
jgi:hypothetical protein